MKRLTITENLTELRKYSSMQNTFWMIPNSKNDDGKSTRRRHVGIRSLPYTDAPTTGEGIRPGELIEVVQTISEHERLPGDVTLGLEHDEEASQVYLRYDLELH